MVTGDAKWTLYTATSPCIWPLTLDYSSYTIYWINYCTFRLESMSMDGSMEKQSLDVGEVYFSSGITQFKDEIYWTQRRNTISSVLSVNKTHGEDVKLVFSGSSTLRLGGIEVVHPSRQPSGTVDTITMVLT